MSEVNLENCINCSYFMTIQNFKEFLKKLLVLYWDIWNPLSSQSSSRYTDNTDSSDSFLLSVPISHCSWQVHQMASSACTELINVNFCWLANTGVSMFRSPKENFLNEFIWVYPALIYKCEQIIFIKLLEAITDNKWLSLVTWNHRITFWKHKNYQLGY